jgi:HlyD family secretion protein
MQSKFAKPARWILSGALGVAVLAWFGWPRAIPVDLATVTKGPMEVTVDDDGKTEVRHVYAVSAPIAGKLLRISHPAGFQGISRHVGDPVTANETVVAVMQPMPPGFIDVRSREQLQAEVAAADAAVKQAEVDVSRLQSVLDLSRIELKRADALAPSKSISAQDYDRVRFNVATNEAALASAKAQVEVRRRIRASLAARLADPAHANARSDSGCCIELRSPVTGRILKIIQDSEVVVPAGAPLIEIGDPLDLDVVADLLSSDAVKISTGAPVRIDGWGGPPISGRVTRVDPAGFLKVSALGIEEQRVHVTIDFVDPPQAWSRLGHDYRVVVHVTTWSTRGALTVPAGALFRQGDDWAAFVVRNARARTTLVQVGHRNNRTAEVLSGLSAGDHVVLHPSDRVSEGTKVAERKIR